MSHVLRSTTAALLLGLGVGMALVQGATSTERLACGQALRHWHTQALHWQHEADHLNQELGRINQRSEKHLYIQEISVTVTSSPVPHAAVVEALTPYTQALLGLSLSYLKAPVIYHLFNDRLITIGTGLYQLKVQALLLGPHSELMLSVINDPGASEN